MVAMAWFENPALYRDLPVDHERQKLASARLYGLGRSGQAQRENTGSDRGTRSSASRSRWASFAIFADIAATITIASPGRDTPPQCSTPQGKKAFLAMESQYDIIPQQPQNDPHFNFCPFCQEPYARLTCPKCGHSTDNDSSRERPWQAVVGPSRPEWIDAEISSMASPRAAGAGPASKGQGHAAARFHGLELKAGDNSEVARPYAHHF